MVRTGISERGVYRILSGETKGVTWEVADTIITRTVGPLHWHTEPELSEIYWAFNFAREDLMNPLENPAARKHADKVILKAWDQSRTRGEAGGRLGLSLACFTKILDPVLKRHGRPLKKQSVPLGYCRKGLHDLMVVGKSGGGCRACRALAARKRYVNKSGKTRAKRVPV